MCRKNCLFFAGLIAFGAAMLLSCLIPSVFLRILIGTVITAVGIILFCG